MNTSSIYQYALNLVRDQIRQELNTADDTSGRIEQFAGVFGSVTLSIFTHEGYQNILQGIDAQQAATQAYLTNFIARTAIHLRMDLDTMGPDVSFSKLQNVFSETLGDLGVMELFDTQVTDRIDHSLIESGGPLVIYLITAAFRSVLSELSAGV
jgi:hypothetical protein